MRIKDELKEIEQLKIKREQVREVVSDLKRKIKMRQLGHKRYEK